MARLIPVLAQKEVTQQIRRDQGSKRAARLALQRRNDKGQDQGMGNAMAPVDIASQVAALELK